MWVLRSVVGPTILHRVLWDALGVVREFGGCIPSFMESLIANFITKIFSFSNLFGNSWGNSYIQFVVIMDLVLIHLWWKETRQTDKKALKYFMRGCSFLTVGSVKAYVKKVTMS